MSPARSLRPALAAAALAAATLACGASPEAAREEALERARAIAADPSASAAERARAHRRLAASLGRLGQLESAAEHLEEAAELLAGDGAELAATLNALSDVCFRLGDFERQEAVLWRALEAAVGAGDRRASASAWNNLGVSYAARGRPSAALAAYHRGLELRRGGGSEPSDRRGLASSRHNLGVQLLHLGRVGEGLEELRRAEAARRQLGEGAALGRTLSSLAWGLGLEGRHQAALDAYAEALELLEEASARHDLAVAFEQRAQLHRVLGDLEAARDDLQRSLELLEAGGGAPPLDAAYLELGLGAVEREMDAPGDRAAAERAVTRLRQAIETFDTLGAQEGRVLARLELARALRAREGGSDETVAQLEAAIEIVESARSDLRLPSFRATFLGGWQAVYRELVDLLASAAHEASLEGDPAAAERLAGRALEVAERGRARSLLDRLAAGTAERPVPGSQTWLDLRAQVEKLEARTLLEPIEGSEGRGAAAGSEAALAALRQARIALEREQEVARREAAPTPAASPAGLAAIRRQLDAETVLLVYSLGRERSWLWRLDLGGLEVLPLPPAAEIEAAARNAHQLLPLYDRRGYGRAARAALARLARQVLGPVAAKLGPGRLAVVPDGALHLVPFGVLPMPVADEGVPPPLAASHEVVHLPSASTLVELRRRAGREPAPRLLAVVADPVFEAGDPRLAGIAPEAAGAYLARTRRALGGRLGRLPASAEEAARIAEIARRSLGAEAEVYRGFEASRGLITGGGLAGFRILHFATHGVIDAEDAALAGLVLSLYGADGRPRDGLLRARDLHGLRLGADLVVLSACRTALGQEVRGEGLVGLADGFFAAGARHLVVSLWDVDDRATAELMARFYRHLLLAGRGPGEALRQAQRELWEETEWPSPAFWGAFLAVGDWGVLE